MTRKTTLSVTADDIARGQRCRPDSCPIALRLTRLTGARWAVYDNIAVPFKGNDRSWNRVVHLPPAAQKFIDAFDASKRVEPFEFEVEMEVQES